MKNVFLKSVVRRPMKTLIIFLILGAITFGFVIRGVEYSVVTREVDRLTDFYKPVGQVTTSIAENFYVDPAIDRIKADERIDCLNVSRVFFGSMHDIYTANHSAMQFHNNCMYLYGKPKAIRVEVKNEGTELRLRSVTEEYLYDYMLRFLIDVDRVDVGLPEHAKAGEDLRIDFGFNDPEMKDKLLDLIQEGERYYWKIRIVYSIGAKGLQYYYTIDAMQEEPFFYPAPNVNEDVFVEAWEEDASLRRINQHGAILLTTKDMNLPMMIQENQYLADGRFLTSEDERLGNPVCVISRELAELRDLKIGDKITMDVYNSDGYQVKLGVENIPKIYEIVGTYGSLRIDETTISHINMYVPDSTLDASWPSKAQKTLNSFSLKSPGDGKAFLADYEQEFFDGGYRIKFLENDWENFYAATAPMEQAIQTNVVLFLIIFVAGVLLCVLLFMVIHRGNWVKLRLIGLPVGRLRLQLMIPLMLGGSIFIGAAAAAASDYAVNKAKETLTALEAWQTSTVIAQFPIHYLFGLWLILSVCWFVLVVMGVLFLNRGSLLVQLRGRKAR